MTLAVAELLEISTAREAALSPTGGAIAFRLAAVEAEREVGRLRVVALVGGGERELIEPVEGWGPAWSPDGDALAYVAPGDGDEELRLLFLPDAASRPIAAFAVVVGRPVFSPRGDRIALVVRDATGSVRLAVVSLDGEADSIAARPGEEIFGPSWDPDGERLAFGRSRPGADGVGPTSTIETWEPGAAPVSIETGCAYATCPAWSPDGRVIAFVGVARPRLGLGDPALRPWLVPASGGEAIPAGDGPEGVVLEPAPVGPAWSSGGDALYLRVARAGAIDLVRIDLDANRTTRLTRGRQVVDFSVAGDAVSCSSIAPDDPGSIWVTASVGLHRLESSVGEWTRRRGDAVPVRERRAFRATDGRALDGWLAGVDPALAPQPTLLAFHGGPHGFFGPGFQGGHFYRDVLASRGWVVLTLNATGSGSYGGDFADGVRGAWGERDLPEHLAALDELVAMGLADPDRLAVAGYSYGGYLAAWAITQDDRFAAAVLGAPITELESFERTSDIGTWYTPWQMNGTLPENQERYRRLSPANHAAAVATPTLILHGEADRRVPFAQGRLLRDRLAVAGRARVELVPYPDAGHLFYSSGKPGQRLDFNRRIVDWLETNVNRGACRG